MKNIKKLALLLAMLMLTSVLAGTLTSCKKNQEDDETSDSDTVTTSGTSGSDAVDVDWREYLPTADFDGADVNIVIEGNEKGNWYLDEDEVAGNVYQEEVAKRNAYIENTYNVYLNFTHENGDWAGFHQVCQTNLWADTSDFDIIAPRYYYTCDTAGYFLNLNGIETVNLENPYWFPGWTKNATINGITYLAASYIVPSPVANTVVLFMNNYYAEDLQIDIDDLKQTVYDGDWTLEEMTLLMRAATSDNGDHEWDFNDKYGLAYSVWGGRAMLVASGFRLTSTASDGSIEWHIDSENNVNVFQTLYKFFNNDVLAYYGGSGTESTSAEGDVNLFTSGRALFWAHSMGQASLVAKKLDSFSILPLPKYDNKTQEDYIATSLGTNVVGIMKNAKNPEMSGTILEAMSILSYVDVTPVYYEEMLKVRYQSDPDAAKMIDFINSKVDIDFAFINSNNIGTVAEKPFDMIVDYNRNYVSGMRDIIDKLDSYMEVFYEAYSPDNA